MTWQVYLAFFVGAGLASVGAGILITAIHERSMEATFEMINKAGRYTVVLKLPDCDLTWYHINEAADAADALVMAAQEQLADRVGFSDPSVEFPVLKYVPYDVAARHLQDQPFEAIVFRGKLHIENYDDRLRLMS